MAAVVESYTIDIFPGLRDSEATKLRKMHSLYPPVEHPFPVLMYCVGVYGFLYVASKNTKLSKKFLQATMLAVGSAAWTLTSQRIAEMHFAIIIANCVFSIMANLVIAFFMFVGRNDVE
uniref:Elongation of fatty acids protein n=1 Tax=Panagrellus redivivus TaxID=6233 RepID=A0A7E4VSR9_PANRE